MLFVSCSLAVDCWLVSGPFSAERWAVGRAAPVTYLITLEGHSFSYGYAVAVQVLLYASKGIILC